MNTTIGKKILQLRKEANMSQKQLADYLCVSNKTICKWESDKELPDINSLVQISKIFNVSLENLIYENNTQGHI